MIFTSCMCNPNWQRKFAWLPVRFIGQDRNTTIWLEHYEVRDTELGATEGRLLGGEMLGDCAWSD